LQPIKVESRKSISGQTSQTSDDWRVVGYASDPLNRNARSRAKSGKSFVRSPIGILTLSFLALFMVVAIAIAQSPQTSRSFSASIWDGIDQLAVRAGLGTYQISLSGHRYSSDIDLFAALNAHSGKSLIGVDVTAATNELAKLSWVESADIQRKFPDELVVRIDERRPFAVWKLNEKFWLVDMSGRKLAPVSSGHQPGLPEISGEGANGEFARLWSALDQFYKIRSEISLFRYVGMRRWSLTLGGGVVVELPADLTVETLQKLKTLRNNGRIWSSDLKSVDLRLADRISIARGAFSPTGTLSAADLTLSGSNIPSSSSPTILSSQQGG